MHLDLRASHSAYSMLTLFVVVVILLNLVVDSVFVNTCDEPFYGEQSDFAGISLVS
jgi:hypothetical protein